MVLVEVGILMNVGHMGVITDAHSKAVQALDKVTGEVVMEFQSAMEAERHGFNNSHVSACCRGERKSHKGYIWRYTS